MKDDAASGLSKRKSEAAEALWLNLAELVLLGGMLLTFWIAQRSRPPRPLAELDRVESAQ